MSHRRIFLLTACATSPLLVIALVSFAPSQWASAALVAALWAVSVASVAAVLWKRVAEPIDRLMHDVGAQSPTDVSRTVRRIQHQMHQCLTLRQQATELVDDISTGLGEGLLVVNPDLTVRLANPRALHFLGIDHVEDGAHLLDLVRDPDVVAKVRAAVGGENGLRAPIENPRGVWELRPFPVSHGGAVVLITEVGPVRRAADLRRRFVQDLSHELRSPLAVMRTTVEALEDEVPEDVSAMMVRQVERITRLTDELYELASIEAGEMKLKPDSQPLMAIVRQVANDFRTPADQAEVALAITGPEELHSVFDRRALSRVLSNLVDNAIKYNRQGGTVDISVRGGQQAVHIEVADTGIGIPTSEVAAVQQRFYRIDNARTPGEGGLGLGLAIVKHMVQQMGGSLSLDSREDVGTKVTVTLPKIDNSQTPE